MNLPVLKPEPATINGWGIAIAFYLTAAVITFLPSVAKLVRRKSEDHLPTLPLAGYSEDATLRLKNNLAINYPRVVRWNREIETLQSLHYYFLGWTIPASVLVPLLAQAIDGSLYSKWFLTLVSAHAVLLHAFNKGLGVEDYIKMYKKASFDFESLLATLLDRPGLLGADERAQVDTFIDRFASIREYVERSIRDSTPAVPEPTQVYAVRRSEA